MRGALELSVGPGEDGRGDERREVLARWKGRKKRGKKRGGGVIDKRKEGKEGRGRERGREGRKRTIERACRRC